MAFNPVSIAHTGLFTQFKTITGEVAFQFKTGYFRRGFQREGDFSF